MKRSMRYLEAGMAFQVRTNPTTDEMMRYSSGSHILFSFDAKLNHHDGTGAETMKG